MVTSLLNGFMTLEKMTNVFIQTEDIVNRMSTETILVRPLLNDDSRKEEVNACLDNHSDFDIEEYYNEFMRERDEVCDEINSLQCLLPDSIHTMHDMDKVDPVEDLSLRQVLQLSEWNHADERSLEESVMKKAVPKYDKDKRAEKVINALDSKLHSNEIREVIYRVMGLPEPCPIRLNPWKPQMIFSRRNFLQLTKEFPDPAGLFAPLTVNLKKLAQRLNIGKEMPNWLTNDEKEEVNNFIGRFRTYFLHIPMMPFPLFTERGKIDGELVAFCHSDKIAYAAAVYFMSSFDNATTLILAKVRLLPSPDPLTRRAYARPEADLRAVELGLSLLHEAQKVLSNHDPEVKIGAATCLTDCRTTFHRLSERHSDKMEMMNWFARQRMAKITEMEGSILRHHSNQAENDNGLKEASADGYLTFAFAAEDANPAKLATRGLNAFHLENPPGKVAMLWWRGTDNRDGMRKALKSFPSPEPLDFENRDQRYAFCGAVDPMYKRIKADHVDAIRSWIPAVEETDSLYISTEEIRGIGYGELIDIVALRIREEYLKDQRSILLPNDTSFIKMNGELSDEEREWAEIMLIRQHQSRWRDQWERIGGLRPQKDGNKIIRKGISRPRMADAPLDLSNKLPFIIFPNDPFTHKLIHHYHREEERCIGDEITLESLRERFWLIGGLKTVKKALRNCDACKQQHIPVPFDLPSISTMAIVSCLLTVVTPCENASIKSKRTPADLPTELDQSSPPPPITTLLPRMTMQLSSAAMKPMKPPRSLSSWLLPFKPSWNTLSNSFALLFSRVSAAPPRARVERDKRMMIVQGCLTHSSHSDMDIHDFQVADGKKEEPNVVFGSRFVLHLILLFLPIVPSFSSSSSSSPSSSSSTSSSSSSSSSASSASSSRSSSPNRDPPPTNSVNDVEEMARIDELIRYLERHQQLRSEQEHAKIRERQKLMCIRSPKPEASSSLSKVPDRTTLTAPISQSGDIVDDHAASAAESLTEKNSSSQQKHGAIGAMNRHYLKIEVTGTGRRVMNIDPRMLKKQDAGNIASISKNCTESGRAPQKRKIARCEFCNRTNHSADQCRKVVDEMDRRAVLTKYRRCFSCLSKNCNGICGDRCERCTLKGHHSTICMEEVE
ncbi:hypothetical protein PRIPAC_96190 [Pristionchus pacificus]|uniref:Uncharacterized protein n=1 Tax=Pristionchus pacificus TaxID=54126 RepID=A0A2A6B372_PRIPA|nr:hypothetical protein PRIPAC_96190 [Pristionchus pacificus]|eukprot:PDM60311.1 hypothetical protein PRIPAC_54136 [Pristionchus pacificus]